MCSSQAIYRRQFARVFLSLSFLLASITLGQNSVLGQQRIFSPEQPQQSHRLNLRFSGEQPRALAMVSGDFDEDGVPDLVIGYGMEKGGLIALLRGNPDAIAPRTEATGSRPAGMNISIPSSSDRSRYRLRRCPT
jgi:hypothetical protein